jgi:HK97 family phage prohead protease
MHKTVRWNCKAIDSEAGAFEGHASVFGYIDRQGDIVMPGAFQKRLDQFLETGIVLFNHDPNEVIGAPLDAREDAQGLWFRASIAKTPRAQEVRELMRDGVIKQVSFGYRVYDAVKLTRENIGDFTNANAADPAAVEQAVTWGFALTDLEVYDISPVSVAANPLTDILTVKGGSGGRPFDDESVAALGAVRALIERMRDIAELRNDKGARLSNEFLARVEALHGALERLREFAKRVAPNDDTATGEELQARVHALRAKLLALDLAALSGD